ncbi:hypothetical protein MKW98_026009, partial [Papaver atlanticum]
HFVKKGQHGQMTYRSKSEVVCYKTSAQQGYSLMLVQSVDNALVLTVPWLQRNTKDYGVSQNIIELEYLRQPGMFFYKYIPSKHPNLRP